MPNKLKLIGQPDIQTIFLNPYPAAKISSAKILVCYKK